MKKFTWITAALLAGSSLVVSGSAVAIDSFFDVFFEVEYDPDSRGPVIKARGTLHETAAAPSRSHTVDIELVALSLVSSGLPDGSTQHEATLAYDIAPLQGGKPTTAYAQLDITCNPKDPSGAPRCDVARARASDRNRHRGHVTVLK
jgi:hypothetical protein